MQIKMRFRWIGVIVLEFADGIMKSVCMACTDNDRVEEER